MIEIEVWERTYIYVVRIQRPFEYEESDKENEYEDAFANAISEIEKRLDRDGYDVVDSETCERWWSSDDARWHVETAENIASRELEAIVHEEILKALRNAGLGGDRYDD